MRGKFEDSNVLVAENDLNSAKLLCDFLEIEGIKNLTVCHEPSSLMSLFSEKKPIIVLIDVMRNRKENLEFIKNILDTHTNSKIFAMCSDLDNDLTNSLENYKGITIISKPFDFGFLHSLIVDLFSKPNEIKFVTNSILVDLGRGVGLRHDSMT